MSHHFFKTAKNAVKHWYLPLIIGIAFIALSVWVFNTPMESFLTLGIFFSLTFLVSGLFEVIFAIINRHELDNWIWTLMLGIISLVLGVVLLENPALTMRILGLYIGFLALFRSLSAISTSIDLKRYGVPDWKNILLIGILGAIFSVILIWNPAFAGLTLVYWVGLAILALGVINVLVALKLKRVHDLPNGVTDEMKSKMEALKKEMHELSKQMK
jgi:uncharacterized membrane protein HdeD (DUF308 family)